MGTQNRLMMSGQFDRGWITRASQEDHKEGYTNQWVSQAACPSKHGPHKIIADAFDVRLTGTIQPCTEYAKGTAQQEWVPEAKVERSTIPGEGLCINISSPKVTIIWGSKHWLLVPDDTTGIPFSFFLSHKHMLEIRLILSIKKLKALHDTEVKITRCDNDGENRSFTRTCEQEGLGLKFEYMATSTPQQNGWVQHKFQTYYDMGAY